MERQPSLFTKLRSRGDRNDPARSGEDEWFIPYNAKASSSAQSQSGIGMSPTAQRPSHGSLMGVFSAVGGSSSRNHGLEKGHSLLKSEPIGTYNPNAHHSSNSVPRSSHTLPRSNSYSSFINVMRSDDIIHTLPSESSVPTGLNEPKLLFSPLAREIRAKTDHQHRHRAGGHHPEHLQTGASSQGRHRTMSAPRSGRPRRNSNPYEYRPENRRWAVPTMCDMLVLPRPHLLPHVITPPASPDEKNRRYSYDSSMADHDRVLEAGRMRTQEREQWADLVRRRGRSLSMGSTAPPPGAPIIGSYRARSRERERRSKSASRSNSLIRAITPNPGRRRSSSFGSRFSMSRRNSSNRKDKHDLDWDSRREPEPDVPIGFPFPHRQPTRYDAGKTSGQPDLRASIDDDPFRHHSSDTIRRRSRSMPYKSGHSHTRSDPGLLNAVDAVPSPPAQRLRSSVPVPPGRTLQFRQPSVADRGGVVVINRGWPRQAHGPSTGTFKPPTPYDLSKPLPDLPADNAPPVTPTRTAFPPLTSEIGVAISPEVIRPASQTPTYGSTTPKTSRGLVTSPTSPLSPTKLRSPEGGSPTARAFLEKQQQRARTRRAFQSPSQGPVMAHRQRHSVGSDALAAGGPLSAASSSTSSVASPRSSMSESVKSVDGSRRKTALEEAIGRSRAASVGILQEQQQAPRMSPTRAALLDRPNSTSSDRAIKHATVRSSAPPPPKVSLDPAEPAATQMERVASPPLAYPISTTPPLVAQTRPAFLDVQRPTLPHMETATSGYTVFTDASEGWDRLRVSAASTPQPDTKGKLPATPTTIAGDHSPVQSMDDRDFHGLFFRTPNDQGSAFTHSPIPDRYAPPKSRLIMPRAAPEHLGPVGLGYEVDPTPAADILPTPASLGKDHTRYKSEGDSVASEVALATPQLAQNGESDPAYVAYIASLGGDGSTNDQSGRRSVQQRLMAPWINGRPGSFGSMVSRESEQDEGFSDETHGTIMSDSRGYPFPQAEDPMHHLDQAMTAASLTEKHGATPGANDGKRRPESFAPLSPGTFGIPSTDNLDRA
ncbi:hypothetical protein IAU60_002140 [Kwoniella sp. DSM 27419]